MLLFLQIRLCGLVEGHWTSVDALSGNGRGTSELLRKLPFYGEQIVRIFRGKRIDRRDAVALNYRC